VKVVSLHLRRRLPKANVVKTGEGCAVDVLDLVVWHEKVLLPPHVDVVCLRKGVVVKCVVVERLAVRVERDKLALQKTKRRN
jgi:hypothetical protein